MHIAARELFEMFDSKFAALGSNPDEPALKRKKSSGGSGGGSSGGSTSTNAAACADDVERSLAKGNRGKRKSSRGGKAGSEGGQGTGNGGSKKARATPATKGVPSSPAFSATPQAAAAPKLKPTVTPSGEVETSSPTDPESQILLMQRKMAEMQEQIQRMQRQHAEVAAAAAAAAGVSTSQVMIVSWSYGLHERQDLHNMTVSILSLVTAFSFKIFCFPFNPSHAIEKLGLHVLNHLSFCSSMSFYRSICGRRYLLAYVA